MHSSYKKRKEKKLNMQGKDNMWLGYFIINIHMQLRRREAAYISSNFLKPTHSRRKKKGKEVTKEKASAALYKTHSQLLIKTKYIHVASEEGRELCLLLSIFINHQLHSHTQVQEEFCFYLPIWFGICYSSLLRWFCSKLCVVNFLLQPRVLWTCL